MSKHYLQNKLTGTQGQVVGFDVNGNAIAQAPPETGYSKAETLTAATAALYGLPNTAVPDDVFAWLGKFNEHCWKRRTATKTINKEQFTNFIQVNRGGAAQTIQYANDIDKGFVLSNPQTISIPTSIDGAETLASLAPCYIKNLLTDGVYYLPEGTTFDASAAVGTIYYNSSVHYSALNPYGNPQPLKVTSVSVEATGDWELVFSTNRNAYPDSGVVGGYEYEYLFRPFDHLTEIHTKIETGSYVGTGTYGASNKTNINIGLGAKFFAIYSYTPDNEILYPLGADNSSNNTKSMALSFHDNTPESFILMPSAQFIASFSDGVLSMYTTSAYPGAQCNTANTRYYWIAIG